MERALWFCLVLIIVGALIEYSGVPNTLWELVSFPSPRWPKPGQHFINSLGVLMVPAGTDGVLFSVYDVRLKDFQRFAKETGLAVSSQNLYCFKVLEDRKRAGYARSDFVKDTSENWQNPGFSQTPDDPVVAVSWDEAQMFCLWITRIERSDGLIGPNQRYRLPKIDEWNRAAGNTTYPWGNTWPPTAEDGNFSDRAWERSTNHKGWGIIQIDDGYAFTSPVGSFRRNPFGLYDMAGNVSQMSEEPDPNDPGKKLWRGSNWTEHSDYCLVTRSQRESCGEEFRYNCLGFRLVFETNMAKR
jgi:formylglycine-generating enzyme required for sulfatase activity